jgi:hypothetical protein
MAAGIVHRNGGGEHVWLAIVLLTGCAKADETPATPASPAPVAAHDEARPAASDGAGSGSAAGATSAPLDAPPQARPDDPRFTLLVSNQSSTLPQVDIQVRIDGRRVVDEAFALGMGHTVKSYEFRLSQGSHEIQATAHDGAATYRGSIDVQAELWGALLFWRSPKDGARLGDQGPAFTFQTQDSPIRLR